MDFAKSALPDLSVYARADQAQLMKPIRAHLLAEFKGQDFPKPSDLSLKKLSVLVGSILWSLEELFGEEGKKRAIVKLPIHIFGDFSADGALYRLLKYYFDFRKVKKNRLGEDDLKDRKASKPVVSLFRYLSDNLENDGFVETKKFAISKKLPVEKIEGLESIIAKMGGQLVKSARKATHFIVPNSEEVEQADESQEWVRVIHHLKDVKMALVHFWYYPDSYDSVIPEKYVHGQDPETLKKKQPVWRVYERYVYDSFKYNEWMNEFDYEPVRYAEPEAEPQTAVEEVKKAVANDVDKVTDMGRGRRRAGRAAKSAVPEVEEQEAPDVSVVKEPKAPAWTVRKSSRRQEKEKRERAQKDSKSKRAESELKVYLPLKPGKRKPTSVPLTIEGLVKSLRDKHKALPKDKLRSTPSVEVSEQILNSDLQPAVTPAKARPAVPQTTQLLAQASSSSAEQALGARPAGSLRPAGTPAQAPYYGVQRSLPRAAPPSDPPPIKAQSFEIPSHADWFDLQTIHERERKALPEFFADKYPAKTPQRYMYYRNFMINLWRRNARCYLTQTVCRRVLAGDVGSIMRVFNFLEHNGLINYKVQPTTLPQGVVAVPRKVPEAMPDPDGKPAMSPRKLSPLERLLTFGMPKLQDDRKECYICSEACKKKYYRCLDEPSVYCCFVCYASRRPKDGHVFSQVNEKQSDWSEEETLLLLRAVQKYGENWESVAEHVGTRSSQECILQFIRQPIDGLVDEQDPAKPKNELPFARSANPVMTMVAFLASSVSPAIAAAAAKAAIDALGIITANAPVGAGGETGQDDGKVPAAGVKAGKKRIRERSESEPAEPEEDVPAKPAGTPREPDYLREVSTEENQVAAAVALGCAAARAQKSADEEEYVIRRLMLDLCQKQAEKVELKLKRFDVLEKSIFEQRKQSESAAIVAQNRIRQLESALETTRRNLQTQRQNSQAAAAVATSEPQAVARNALNANLAGHTPM